MTGSKSPGSAGHIFATHQAPYLRYLDALKSKWHEVRVLEQHLRGVADKAKTACMPGESRPELVHPAVEILDIQNDTGSISKRLTVAATLTPRSGNAVPKHIDNFLGHLRECEPDVNTRIVVLYSEFVREDCEAVASLLFCHILGVELNLRPADVSNLACLSGFEAKIPALRRTPLRAGVVSFGPTENSQSSIVAADLGPRKLGKGEPNVVVVHFSSCNYAWESSAWLTPSDIWGPPLFSDWMSSPSDNGRETYSTPIFFFTHALRCCLKSHARPNRDAPTGLWLTSLIHMEAIKRAGELDSIVESWLELQKLSDRGRLYDLSTGARGLRVALQASVNQVSAFQRNRPKLPLADYEEAKLMLERLHAESKAIVEDIQALLDTQIQQKNIQTAELAINESRSAIAVTVLAFVFIPINLASSVYGMNVQEINQTGHSIWGFVVTAMIFLLFSGLGWTSWRATCNWRQVIQEARSHTHHAYRREWSSLSKLTRLKLLLETFQKREWHTIRRLALFVGLSSLETRSSEIIEC